MRTSSPKPTPPGGGQQAQGPGGSYSLVLPQGWVSDVIGGGQLKAVLLPGLQEVAAIRQGLPGASLSIASYPIGAFVSGFSSQAIIQQLLAEVQVILSRRDLDAQMLNLQLIDGPMAVTVGSLSGHQYTTRYRLPQPGGLWLNVRSQVSIITSGDFYYRFDVEAEDGRFDAFKGEVDKVLRTFVAHPVPRDRQAEASLIGRWGQSDYSSPRGSETYGSVQGFHTFNPDGSYHYYGGAYVGVQGGGGGASSIEEWFGKYAVHGGVLYLNTDHGARSYLLQRAGNAIFLDGQQFPRSG